MGHTHFERAGLLSEFRKYTQLERGERMVIDGYMVGTSHVTDTTPVV